MHKNQNEMIQLEQRLVPSALPERSVHAAVLLMQPAGGTAAEPAWFLGSDARTARCVTRFSYEADSKTRRHLSASGSRNLPFSARSALPLGNKRVSHGMEQHAPLLVGKPVGG